MSTSCYVYKFFYTTVCSYPNMLSRLFLMVFRNSKGSFSFSFIDWPTLSKTINISNHVYFESILSTNILHWLIYLLWTLEFRTTFLKISWWIQIAERQGFDSLSLFMYKHLWLDKIKDRPIITTCYKLSLISFYSALSV